MLAHFAVGDGPRPVVLLHGFLGSARNLRSLAQRLAEREPSLRIVALDLPGHGASPPLPPDADLAALARDVLTTTEALGLGPLHLVGHSLGGRVALRAGLLEPARIEDVVLLDTTPSPTAGRGGDIERVVERAMGALLAAPAVGASRDVFHGHLRGAGLDGGVVAWLLLNLARTDEGYRWAIDRQALAALHARTSQEDLWAAIEGPRRWGVRCIRGSRSPFVSEADARRLAAAGCPVDTLEMAGHFLHVDQPAALLELLAAHLRAPA